jgi:hypothetical protein
VIRRQLPGRPQLSSLDRLLWLWLYRIWPQVIDTKGAKCESARSWTPLGQKIETVEKMVSFPFRRGLGGTVDQELLTRIEYLAAENRILKTQLKGQLKLSDAERATLAEIGHRLGRLAEVATVAAGHYPGLVPQAGGPQIRWLEGAPRPRTASDQSRGRSCPALPRRVPPVEPSTTRRAMSCARLAALGRLTERSVDDGPSTVMSRLRRP